MHIHGAKDELSPLSPNTEFSKTHIKPACLDLKIYPDKGHLILWQDYELVRDIITDFVRK